MTWNSKSFKVIHCSVINVLCCFQQLRYIIIIICACQQLFYFISFIIWWASGEGGIWTLAPLLTTCTLSRGVPSTSWVLLQMRLNHQLLFCFHRRSNAPTERVGFEPTRPFGQTVFKTASLWPLRYLSVFCTSISARFILSSELLSVNHFFYIFWYFLFCPQMYCHSGCCK